jgi:endonuclease/exonuclease/phosphatase (EEP) superfamily protein YafD
MKFVAIAAALIPTVGTVLSLIRHPHWIFRLWDFPRVQVALVAVAGSVSYAVFYYDGRVWEIVMLATTAIAVAWQIYKIYPYTPLARKQVKSAGDGDAGNTIRILVSNVLMENEDSSRFIALVKKRQPDLLLAVETDQRWAGDLADALSADYPHKVLQVQDNYYGMVVFSKLELRRPKVRFLVQEDIPSIHATVVLRSGAEAEVHLLHPRPPEPVRDQRSTPRDAELIVVGKSIEKKKDVPTIVAGDLNDVAWSETSQLFVRISGLLDPRIGRGFYNSYNARNPLARFPLDHIFHSTHFKIQLLERQPSIGSDHFPIYAELVFAPEAPAEQEPSSKKSGDDRQAAERVKKEQEDHAEGKDRPKE